MQNTKKRNRVYESRGEPVFQGILIAIFILLGVTFLYPYWHVAVTSLTWWLMAAGPSTTTIRKLSTRRDAFPSSTPSRKDSEYLSIVCIQLI